MDDFGTERLEVRRWRHDLPDGGARGSLGDDLERLLTPRVLEHLPEPLQRSAREGGASGWLSSRAGESDVFLVSSRTTDRMIGLLMLAFPADASEVQSVHLGYLFAETAWGQGYATELVRGLIAALEGRDPVMLIGGVGRGNRASSRVLLKAGFRISPERSTADTDVLIRYVF